MLIDLLELTVMPVVDLFTPDLHQDNDDYKYRLCPDCRELNCNCKCNKQKEEKNGSRN